MPTTPQALITTGLNGLVGSKFATEFADRYTFTNLDIKDPTQPVDITDADQVRRVFEESPATTVVHLAAYTDVTGAWQQTDDTSGPAYQVNVVGTQNVIDAAVATNKHVIHLSTAFVFDGQKDGLYTEEDMLSPIEWYGYTKAKAEEIVQESTGDWTILRLDFPFRSDPFPRPDIVRKIVTRMREGQTLFSDHFFGPTFIDDLAKVIDWATRTQTTGLFNASAGEQWSDFAFGQLLNDRLHLGLTPQAGSLTEYLQTQSRPYQKNTALDTSKLRQHLDFTLTSIPDAIGQVTLADTP